MKRRIVFLAGLSIVLGWVAVGGFFGLFGRPVHADSFTLPVTDVADLGPLAADVTDTGYRAAPGPVTIPLFSSGCTVTSTLDSGPGSLRACIAQLGAGDMITFDPVVFPPDDPQTITLNSALPAIVTDNVTIDGSDAGVILNGGSGLPGDTIGLVIDGASHVVIKGLQILNFPGDGIVLQNGASNNTIGGTNGSPGSSCSGACNLISGNQIGVVIKDSGTMHNTVSGNYIGTSASGTEALGNRANGVGIREGSQYNVIGGDTAGQRNLIDGVVIINSGTMYNIVSGNYIGTDVSGTAALENGGDGVYIGSGAQDNLIGGDTAEERNLISGNGGNGVRVKGPDTMRNTVRGNYIGTNVSGTTALGNGYDGVKITDGAQDNLIGGSNASPGDSCTGHCNLISGNIDGNGVTIRDSGTMSNTVSGNYIGTNVSGTEALSNTWHGVRIVYGAQYNLIGGDTPEERNLISGNSGDGVGGVFIIHSGTMSNTVSGNYIGTNASGTAAIGNGFGVGISEGAQYNLIGGDTAGERNLISGNDYPGVGIQGSNTMSNTVSGNYIGTDANGTAPLGNGYHGVVINMGAQYNVIGGATPGERNVISGNGRRGVNIHHSNTTSNTVSGNYIGTNASGIQAIGNAESGVSISGSAQYNVIGGATPEERNVISGNGRHGVRILGSDTTSNTVSGNYIGTNASGTEALSNTQHGVFIGDGAQYNVIGSDTAGDCNLISGNGFNGVFIWGIGTMYNTVSGNYVGTNASGTAAIPNGGSGIQIRQAAQYNTIGGDMPGANNIIAFNADDGVAIIDLDVLGASVLSNSIFSNGGLGIDLGDDGVTANDAGDGDTGANNLQNFPVLTSATSDATSTTILGALNSIPNTTFRLELFSNTACDPSGFGEGQALLGSTTVTTDGSGDASFTVTFPTPVPEGQFVTATATDPDNNTSEFCQCKVVGDVDEDGVSDEVEDGAPNGGDGNNDGIPDRDQNNVASLPNAEDARYVTLASPDETSLSDVRAVENPSPGDAPPGVDFPVGFFEFAVLGIAPGGNVAVALLLPPGETIDTYYKYGPTPDIPTNHWYEFLLDGTTGAEILADRVVLHFVDGQRGDDDLTANGEVIEPGSPGLTNHPPTVGAIAAPLDPVQVGTVVNVSADFTDPNSEDIHTATWDWGDESTSDGTVANYTVSGSHTYDTPGVYTIELTVTDNHGEVGSAVYQFVVVYNPEGGFVTGGGWINSPEGAYTPDPSLTGKATFGFVAKYKRGADIPTGETEFRFRVADLNFHSEVYQWLVVAGPKAQFKGTGTINGAGNYGFMLTAIDAALTPSTDVDLFRIKIWDKVTDVVIYDNQMDADDDADAATDIGGGSIVIHKEK